MIVVVLVNLVLIGSLGLVFFYAPVDAAMGINQKLFYIHLPSALAGFLSLVMLFVGSMAYLFRPGRRVDHFARACGESAWVFCTLTLITGMIWAKQAWSVWWVWDSRLTSFFVLWCVLSAYMVLRRGLAPGPVSARLGAAFGILGFLNLPIVYLSIHYWQTLHPKVITRTGIAIEGRMLVALVLMAIGVIGLAGVMIRMRYQVLAMEDRVGRLIHARSQAREQKITFAEKYSG